MEAASGQEGVLEIEVTDPYLLVTKDWLYLAFLNPAWKHGAGLKWAQQKMRNLSNNYSPRIKQVPLSEVAAVTLTDLPNGSEVVELTIRGEKPPHRVGISAAVPGLKGIRMYSSLPQENENRLVIAPAYKGAGKKIVSVLNELRKST